MINGAALEEAPHSVNQLYSQCPGLREAARTMVEKRREIVGAARSLYLTIREFAITHNQDSKVDIIGTDNLVNNVVLIIKNTGTTLHSTLGSATPLTGKSVCIVILTVAERSQNNYSLFQHLAPHCSHMWTASLPQTWTR